MLQYEEMILEFEGLKPQLKELAAALTKKLGYPPEMQFRIGGVIAANAGPDLVGSFFKGKD